jgi:Flp pilus assembly protein TadG
VVTKSKLFSGQGLVEFALTLPILLFLVIGTLDLGTAFFMKVELENAAREGAYYLVYNTIKGKADAFALTKAAVQIEGENSGITIPLADIEVSCVEGVTVNNACPSGSTVVVIVRHQMSLVIDIFFNGPLNLTGDARMLIP